MHTCVLRCTYFLQWQCMFRIRKWGLPSLSSVSLCECQEWEAIRKPLAWSRVAGPEASSPVAPSHKTQLKMNPCASQTKAFCTVHPKHTRTHTHKYPAHTHRSPYGQSVYLWIELVESAAGTFVECRGTSAPKPEGSTGRRAPSVDGGTVLEEINTRIYTIKQKWS